MTELKQRTHPKEEDLADYLANTITSAQRAAAEEHIAACNECLEKIVLSHEVVSEFNKDKIKEKRKAGFMKKINPYLILAMITFILSFIFSSYFLQLLVATLLFGAKWIMDSKTTRMLITIYDAWKTGGDHEAGRIIKNLNSKLRL